MSDESFAMGRIGEEIGSVGKLVGTAIETLANQSTGSDFLAEMQSLRLHSALDRFLTQLEFIADNVATPRSRNATDRELILEVATSMVACQHEGFDPRAVVRDAAALVEATNEYIQSKRD